MTDDGWVQQLRGISEALAKLEQAASDLTASSTAAEPFLRTAEVTLPNATFIAGLRIGLAYVDALTWLHVAPFRIAEFRHEIARLDEAVEVGDLPKSAHSWRFQLAERLDRLDQQLQRLTAVYQKQHAALTRVATE